MPLLIIYGIPGGQKSVEVLVKNLSSVVSEKMKLSPERVSVFYPPAGSEQFGEKLVCSVDGCVFSGTSEQIPELRRDLENSILATLSRFAENHIFQCNFIEVVLHQEQAADGVRWNKPKKSTK